MPLAKPDDPSTPVLSHFSLKNRVAAVTGGARGIGLEIVRALAEAGCVGIGFTYTTSTSAPQIAKELSETTGCDIRAYQTDVRNRESITNAIHAIAKDFDDRLDICVANAGVAAEVDALHETEAQWRDMMGVNLDGAMWTAQAAGNIFKRLKDSGRGKGDASMIFTASVSAILVNVPQKQAAYNASKAAVVHLAKSLAVEWADFARVNCISPGFIDTESESSSLIAGITDSWADQVPVPPYSALDPSRGKARTVDGHDSW